MFKQRCCDTIKLSSKILHMNCRENEEKKNKENSERIRRDKIGLASPRPHPCPINEFKVPMSY